MLATLRRAALVAAVVLAAAGFPAPARASIVYVQGGNVFLADDDGGHASQVTTDGSLAAPDRTTYRSPSMADDGTIVAARGAELIAMRENGQVLSHAIPENHAYPSAVAISPDGARVHFDNYQLTQCTVYVYSCGFYPQAGATVATVDGRNGVDDGGSSPEDGQWVGNGALVLQTQTSNVGWLTVGATTTAWFDPLDVMDAGFGSSFGYPIGPVVSRRGDLLAVVERPTSSGGNPSVHDVLQLFAVGGHPPADAPTAKCQFSTDDAGGFQHPALTADDKTVLYSDSAGVQDLPVPAGCAGGAAFGTTGSGAMIAGASDVSVSVAANNPGPRYTPPGAGGGAGAPSGGATPGGAITLTVHAGGTITAKSLGAHGLAVRLACSTACRFRIRLTLPVKAARRVGLTRRRKGTFTLAAKAGSATGPTTVRLRPGKAKVRRLRRARHQTLSLTTSATAAGKTVTRTRKVRLTHS